MGIWINSGPIIETDIAECLPFLNVQRQSVRQIGYPDLMNTLRAPHNLHQFKTPAIRHLAWLCEAPQLLASPLTFYPARFLPEDYLSVLTHWDTHPESVPERLLTATEKRLGHYFERLYEVMLSELMGWPILLKNQQIRKDGRTIGELDFVVRNLQSGELEHHEIAIKYYLGVPDPDGSTWWYGPNAQDRLDLKTGHLLSRQSQLTQRPETQSVLAELGINDTARPRIFMPGYLFYPDELKVTLPDTVPDNHLTGQWCYAKHLDAHHTTRWVPLNKPHWIGPWSQAHEPPADEARAAIQRVEDRGIPALFAETKWHPELQCWAEQDRWFVVPHGWPQQKG